MIKGAPRKFEEGGMYCPSCNSHRVEYAYHMNYSNTGSSQWKAWCEDCDWRGLVVDLVQDTFRHCIKKAIKHYKRGKKK